MQMDMNNRTSTKEDRTNTNNDLKFTVRSTMEKNPTAHYMQYNERIIEMPKLL
jgi:hypothetical protein